MEVNIEKIMDDIRAEIKEKGYTSDMLSFKDVTGKGASHGEMLSDTELADTLDTANSLAVVPFDRPITGNPIAVFIKKLIRKLIRFYIRPIVEQQNEFNAQLLIATETVGRRSAEGGAAELSKKVETLEAELEKANKENEELRQRLERLEQRMTENR